MKTFAFKRIVSLTLATGLSFTTFAYSAHADETVPEAPIKEGSNYSNQFNPSAVPEDAQLSDLSSKEKAKAQADDSSHKNKYPVVFLHGFGVFTEAHMPNGMKHWGGEKYHMMEDLKANDYEVYEANVSSFASNHDRAVELYYYLKGGQVDYGAAHAKKYGHERYGKTYEGVKKNWKPGQKVHLVGHSMGGQTLRLLEEYLRNGDPEERAFQKEHGGHISPLYTGNKDGMISSITTIATPHKGTHASDDFGNKETIKRILYEVAKLEGHRGSKIDFGLKQWGLEQREGESYIEYSKRVEKSKLWTSNDTGLYDLTREGAEKLNEKTSVNPNVYYKTYRGEAVHKGPTGKQVPNPYMHLIHRGTGSLIGGVEDEKWCVNDGMVSEYSADYPTNEQHVNVKKGDAPQKGIWQVMPIMHDFDHTDFTGQDALDIHRTPEELKGFYHDIIDYLISTEDTK
ncbi:YSIRK-targeted triacylglycerol lipase [Staphylococcus massiliensis]|uniref:YSIRK-targeted triacylglycerol lipase n=1 Tax=Staphylococcus massiliensis TaxID=555791 RepID=UPI00370DAE1A